MFFWEREDRLSQVLKLCVECKGGWPARISVCGHTPKERRWGGMGRVGGEETEEAVEESRKQSTKHMIFANYLS